MDLRAKAIAGVRWISIASIVRIGAQFAQVVVLARLLSPADFGLMAVVAAIIAFLQMFSDLGVSNAIIHRQNIAQAQLSGLYWLNVLAGTGLAIAMLAASGPLAALYGEPGLQPVLALGALYLFLNSLWQQLRVMAEKDLRFTPLALLEVAASLAGLAVSIAIAAAGGGVYALILGLLANTATGALLAWPMLARGWRPQWRLRLGELRTFLRFGAYMTGNNLAGTLNSQLDILLGARMLGAQALGLYSLPKNLCLQIAGTVNPIITRVGLPVMAKAQEDKSMLMAVYLQTMRSTASVNFPIYAALAVFAPEIVRLFFGAQWEGSVPVLRVLALWALLRSTGNPVGSLLMACGRADLSFWWNLGWLPAFVFAAWAGSQFGALGLALGLTALGIIGFVPNWYFLVRPLCGAGFNQYCRELLVPFALSGCAGLAAYASVAQLEAPVLRLGIGLACGGVLYLALSFRFNPSWFKALLELLKLKPGIGLGPVRR